VSGETIDDVFLVVRSQNGDRAAFEQLVRRTSRLVYARLYLDTGGSDPHRVEDLVQETFLTAWRSIGQVTDPAGFRTWLLSIARSVTLDSIRRDSRKKRSTSRSQALGDAAENLRDSADTPPQALEREESRRHVREMLASLPQEYAMPLTLRYIAGADYDTIGRQLGLSNGSLRGLLNRGMNKLREMMQKQEGHWSLVTGHSQGPSKREADASSQG
jgi:RNA polymerase sigma-70 factor (ECF subfamily)